MSGFLSTLVGSDDLCGPAALNPLSQLAKGLAGQGEGSSLQRDSFSPAAQRASPSFRSLQPHEQAANAQAQAFFEQQRGLPQHASLHYQHDIPSTSSSSAGRMAATPPPPAWATDFMRQGHAPSPQPDFASERAWQKSRAVDSAPPQEGPAWANDFQQHHQQNRTYGGGAHSMAGDGIERNLSPMNIMREQMHNWQTSGYRPEWQMQPQFHHQHDPQMQMQHHGQFEQMRSEPIQRDAVRQDTSWETAFMDHLSSSPKVSTLDNAQQRQNNIPHESLTARPVSPTQLGNSDGDLLSRTAGELLQNVSIDLSTNEKMRNSSFMELMRKLRDKEVTVQGNDMVEGASAGQAMAESGGASMATEKRGGPICARPLDQESGVSVNMNQQTAMPPSLQTPSVMHSTADQSVQELADAYAEMNADFSAMDDVRAFRSFVGDGGNAAQLEAEDASPTLSARGPMHPSVLGARSAWEEDLDGDWDLDDQLLRQGLAPPTVEETMLNNPQQEEWLNLQDQWDSWQSTSTGFEPAHSYPFSSRNPYLSNAQHARHLPADSVLAAEAAVQQSPRSSRAWLTLGLRQQENEQEALAIKALTRALELQGDLKEAHLALAISYTNENMRTKAYEAMESWMQHNATYSHILQQSGPMDPSSSIAQKHERITGLLVEMAREGTRTAGAEIDAEVQIALGVMFNSSEEYDKACDCFSAALSVRPSDPHLFNRLGATLANSGKSRESLEYYQQSLLLQPNFARATFNLAIAHMQLGEYDQATTNLLRALELQRAVAAEGAESDEDLGRQQDGDESGGSSKLLWDTLSTCANYFKREDLVEACQRRDLQAWQGQHLGDDEW